MCFEDRNPNKDTLITNFKIKDFEMYKKAIELLGDENFRIWKWAYSRGGVKLEGYYSLHFVGRYRYDLSVFWGIIEKLDKGEDINIDALKAKHEEMIMKTSKVPLNSIFDRLDNDFIDSSFAETTLVTNFDRDKVLLYREAIRRYGREEDFQIKNQAYDIYGNRLSDNIMALHYTGPNHDLSAFWKIFRDTKLEEAK